MTTPPDSATTASIPADAPAPALRLLKLSTTTDLRSAPPGPRVTRSLTERTTASAPSAATHRAPGEKTLVLSAGQFEDAARGGADQLDSDSLEMAALARSLAVALIEVFYGSRRLSQVARWLDPALAERIESYVTTRQKLALKPTTVLVVRPGTVSITRLNADTLEASAVVHTPARTRAVALRLERRAMRWKVVELITS